MKKGDLVIYSDVETLPDFTDKYGIVVTSHWKGDWRLCTVLWSGNADTEVHYKYELQLVTNKGRKYGELILEGRENPERNSS